MQFMVNKDGEEVLVDDTEVNRVKAKAKGYEIYESLSSPDGEEKWVSEAIAPRAIKEKGYSFTATKNNLAAARTEREPYSPLRSAATGFASGASMGTDDELAGVGAGIKGAMSGKNPLDAYYAGRDNYRGIKENSREDNPWADGLGQFAGAVAVPGLAAAGNARLGGAIATGAKVGAAQGAIQGAGDAEELSDVPKESLWGAATGGVIGGAGGVIGRGIARPGQTMDEIKDAATISFPSYVKAGWSGFKEGAKDAPGVASMATAPAGAVKGVWEQRQRVKEIQSLVDKSRATPQSGFVNYVKTTMGGDKKAPMEAESIVDPRAYTQRPASPPKMPKMDMSSGEARLGDQKTKAVFGQDMTDKHYITRMLLEPGSNSIKDFVAERAVSAFPGELESDAYKRLLNMGSSGRTKARSFDRDKAGELLLPEFEKSKEVFKKARSNRWNELHGEASKNYPGNDDILVHIGNALEDAERTDSTRGIGKLISEVQNLVGSGIGNNHMGVKQGAWDQVSQAEKFNRLQQARMKLDAMKIRVKKDGLSSSERILKDLAEKIDADLKISPEKVEADSMWSKSKNLEESFFDQAEFKGGLDKYKIGDMMKNTTTAKRFRDNIGRFEEFISDPNMSPELKSEGEKLLKNFKSASGVAEQQRALQEFRYKQGPTSPAIERQTAAMGGDKSPLMEAIQGPSSFMKGADETTRNLSERYFGESFDNLSAAEKDKIVKAWFKIKKNPMMSEDAQDAIFKKKNSGSLGVSGSGASLGEKAKDAGLKYARNRAINYGMDEGYNAVTGTDEGMPDPSRDLAKKVMMEKFNLTESQANLAKKLMPSTMDMAGKIAPKLAKVYENHVSKGSHNSISEPRGKKVLERKIDHNGEALTHEVYNRDHGKVHHYLRKEDGTLVATVQGNVMEGRDGNGLAVGWSNSTTKGQGHGKKAYDLALDTHGMLYSDTSLSPKGSHQVYADHFKNSQGVDVDLAGWGNKNRHKVQLKDQDAFRKEKGINRFSDDQDVDQARNHGADRNGYHEPIDKRAEDEFKSDWDEKANAKLRRLIEEKGKDSYETYDNIGRNARDQNIPLNYDALTRTRASAEQNRLVNRYYGEHADKIGKQFGQGKTRSEVIRSLDGFSFKMRERMVDRWLAADSLRTRTNLRRNQTRAQASVINRMRNGQGPEDAVRKTRENASAQGIDPGNLWPTVMEKADRMERAHNEAAREKLARFIKNIQIDPTKRKKGKASGE